MLRLVERQRELAADIFAAADWESRKARPGGSGRSGPTFPIDLLDPFEMPPEVLRGRALRLYFMRRVYAEARRPEAR